MTIDIPALREAAEKATPGPWQTGRLGIEKMPHVVDFGTPPKAPFMVLREGSSGNGVMRPWPAAGVVHSDDGSSEANAAYIAAANPQAILELLSDREADKGEIERLKAEVNVLRGEIGDAISQIGSGWFGTAEQTLRAALTPAGQQ